MPTLVPEWIAGYRKDRFRPDLMAGLAASAVVIPKAMAYATIAGLPVQVGLYTVFMPMVIYALLGTSRPLSVSTSTTLAILAAHQLGTVVPQGDHGELLRASAMLTLLVGCILVVASMLRLGFLANFISEPALIGFKAGVAIVIVLDQLPKLLGVHIVKVGFFRDIGAIAQQFAGISGSTVLLALGSLLLLVLLERRAPKAPTPLIVVAAGVLAVAFFDLGRHGVAVVGDLPPGLPRPVLPDWSLARELWPGALGIALMSFTESIAAARAFRDTDEPPVVPDRELLATGLANAGGALLGGMVAGGGTTQTAVNREAGARTQLAALVTAAMALLVMLLLAPALGLMPQATLAAVVIVYSVGLIRPSDFRKLLTIRRTEFIWAVVALVGVVLMGALRGIVLSIVVSMIALTQQTADPPVYVLGRKRGTDAFRPRSDEHPDDETFPGLLLLRPEGRLYFGNTARVSEKIDRLVVEYRPQVVVLHMRAVPDLEYTALKALVEGVERMRAQGVDVWLVGINPAVLDVVMRSPLGAMLGRERMFFSLQLAVEHYQRLHPDGAPQA